MTSFGEHQFAWKYVIIFLSEVKMHQISFQPENTSPHFSPISTLMFQFLTFKALTCGDHQECGLCPKMLGMCLIFLTFSLFCLFSFSVSAIFGEQRFSVRRKFLSRLLTHAGGGNLKLLLLLVVKCWRRLLSWKTVSDNSVSLPIHVGWEMLTRHYRYYTALRQFTLWS